MKSFIVRKRTLALFTLALLGLALFAAGVYRDMPGKVKNPPAGVPVTADGFNAGGAGPEQAPKTTDKVTAAAKETSDFFVNYRLDRERARGQRVEWLREVINSAGSGGETRQKAQEHLLGISQSVQKEVELENLIRARGYKEAAVLVDERSVTVVVAAEAFANEESVRIADMVTRSTGVDSQNILIIRKK